MVIEEGTGANRIHLVEEFPASDSRAQIPECIAVLKSELDGLLMSNDFWLVPLNQLPRNATFLGGRIFRCINNVGTASEKFKARFVVQGHRDPGKSLLVHDSATLRQSSMSIILAIASTFYLDVWPLDRNQAYTRSAPTTRLIYVKPDPAFGVAAGMVFQTVRPLYGLADAGDAWGRTIKGYATSDLGLVLCVSDPCLIYLEGSKQPCLMGVYVDDLLFVGGNLMRKIAREIARRFLSKGMTELPFLPSACQIEQKGKIILVQQKEYARTVHDLGTEPTRLCMLYLLVDTLPV